MFATINSTPDMAPLSTIEETALPPPPPTPMTFIFAILAESGLTKAINFINIYYEAGYKSHYICFDQFVKDISALCPIVWKHMRLVTQKNVY